jgi:hypothetical protein
MHLIHAGGKNQTPHRIPAVACGNRPLYRYSTDLSHETARKQCRHRLGDEDERADDAIVSETNVARSRITALFKSSLPRHEIERL